MKAVNWTGYSFDGRPNETMLTSSLTTNFAIANMTNGFHTITVYANDTYGNMGASEPTFFSVKLPETPFPTATVAAALGVAAVVVVLGLFVYFKKCRH